MKNVFILLASFPLSCFAGNLSNMDICLNAIKANYDSKLNYQLVRLGEDKSALIENNTIKIFSAAGSVSVEGLGCRGSEKKNTLGLLFASELEKIGADVKKWTDAAKDKPSKDRSSLYQAKVESFKSVLNSCSPYSEVRELRTKILPQIDLFPQDKTPRESNTSPGVR